MFKKIQLKNGLKVLMVESHKSPVLSIQMWVKTGSADEKKGEEGISHFIEHLVFKGSRKFKVGEIAATVEGAGGELNAYTSFDQTVFYVTISKEFQKVGLEVISEMMGFPKFDEKEINNEREVVIEEIKRSNDSPHRQASRLLFSSVYKKHPYGIPVIGYPENINTVSRKVLVDYYKGRYNPKNMTLVVAGDFKSPDMQKQVNEFFGGFTPNKLRIVKRANDKKIKVPAIVVKKAAFAETIVHIAFPIPKASHKDIAALEVFALILGQGDSSRLNHRLRLGEHLVNFAGSSVFSARDPGFFALSMSLHEKDLAKALVSLQEEILRALAEPPSLPELRKAQTNMASEQFYQLETVDGLARNIGHFQDLYGDPKYFAKFMKQVEMLTPADVLKAGRKYLNSALSFIVMTSGDEKKIEKLAGSWVESFKKDLKKTLKTKAIPKKAIKAKRASFVFKKPASLVSKVERWEMKNGVTVIVRPSFETPVISMRCASLGGSRLETEKNQGATELLSRVWTSGAGRFSEAELNARVDEMAASLSSFGGRNSEGLSMTCLRPFAKDMMGLFFDAFKEPHFEKAAIAREIKSMQESVRLRKDNPSQICVLQYMKSMFGDHPYGRDPYGEEQNIEKLTQQHVRDIYSRKSGLTIVAAGAIDADEFREEIGAALGNVNPGTAQTKKFNLTYPKKDERVFAESRKEQSHILMGYPGLEINDPDRYTLQVMQAILAGQGGRLFLELRDKASLAYSVSPMRMEGIEGGYFGAYIGCSPEKSGTAIKMMKIEFDKLCQMEVPAEELMRAQRYLIGKHDIELQRNSNITSAILFDDIYGIDYLETYKFAQKVRAVDAKAIQALSQKLFARPSVTSLVGPTCPW